MSESLNLPVLGVALLRAAAEGRLHRDNQVYRWHPRTSVRRALATPHINEIGTQLHAFRLIDHRDDNTAVAITERGREVLATYHGGVRRVR